MGLFDKLRNEFIDIIEFVDNSKDTLVYRFPRYQNEIKNNAQLIVREGQLAVFISEGKLADTFTPGTYTLNTQNLPVLTTIKGWKYGFNSPFKAEVYFISTKIFIDQKWGTKNPIILHDQRFGMLETRAFGMYNFKVSDVSKFILEIVGTNGNFTTEDINTQLKSIIITRFTDALGEAALPVEAFASNLNELSQTIFSYMQDDFSAYGIEVTRFLIENISMPDEIKKEIFELSRLNTIDLSKFTQLKSAKAIEEAAKNPSGMAGAGIGMGAGFAMGNQMAQAYTQPSQNPETPPPLPSSLNYFVAINNQQNGPFNETQLKGLVTKGQLSGDTLVWKTGLDSWKKAGEQSDLISILNNTPTPLPEQ